MTTEGKPHFTAKPSRGIWLIVALFLLLSNIYGLVTPIFEASDELYHYPFVHHLVTEHRLPIQDPDNIQLWKQEGGQPPLYYLVAAAATFWIDTGDFGERLVHNPHSKIGIPLAPDNKNMVIHTQDEGFPFEGTTLSVHLIRFLSTLMGAGTVFLTYLIVREVLPNVEHLALAAAAAAAAALNPMFLFITASVNNDNLSALLCTLALWQLVRMLRVGATPRRVVGLGLVVGLASLTKLSALGLTALVAVVITWDAWQRRALRAWLLHGFLAAGLVAAISGWWYLRNWMLYDDPLGFSAWLEIAGARKIPPGIAGLLSEFEGFRISYWGLFGGVNVLMHPLVYKFYDLLTFLAFIGLLLSGGRWLVRQIQGKTLKISASRNNDPRLVQAAILGLWVLILLAALIRWTRLTRASQGRLIFPGIAAVSFFLVLGWASLLPQRWRRAGLSVVVAMLLSVAVAAPWAFIAPAYAVPDAVATLPGDLQPLHITYGDQIELVGYRLSEREVFPGQTLAVELGWRSLQPIEENYSVFVHLYGRDDEFLGQTDTFHGGGLLPTDQWSPGDQVLDTVYVQVNRHAEAPALGRIVVGLYRVSDRAMLAAADPDGVDLGDSPTIGRFKIAAHEPPAYEMPQVVDFQLGQKLALVGYDLLGDPGEVVLYWRAQEPVAVDYTVFVHLLDADGRQVAQADGEPQAGDYPTSWWGAGETVPDRHVLPSEIVGELPPGAYTLSVGLYNLESGDRLPVLLDGVVQGDQITLGPVTLP